MEEATKIEIKSPFTDWHEVSIEQARKYVQTNMNTITAMSGVRKVKFINDNLIRGITVEELLVMDKQGR